MFRFFLLSGSPLWLLFFGLKIYQKCFQKAKPEAEIEVKLNKEFESGKDVTTGKDVKTGKDIEAGISRPEFRGRNSEADFPRPEFRPLITMESVISSKEEAV
jgi:hypothetical protein